MENYAISLFKGYADTHPNEVTLKNMVGLIRNDAPTAEHIAATPPGMTGGTTAF